MLVFHLPLRTSVAEFGEQNTQIADLGDAQPQPRKGRDEDDWVGGVVGYVKAAHGLAKRHFVAGMKLGVNEG